MIPTPWVALVLALAAYRLVRLIGWDDFPPVLRVRSWVTGAELQANGSANAGFAANVDPPIMVWTYRRPLLAHFLQCAFCQGFWVSVAVYLGWRFEPTGTLYALAPFALSGAVGLIAKNLDP